MEIHDMASVPHGLHMYKQGPHDLIMRPLSVMDLAPMKARQARKFSEPA